MALQRVLRQFLPVLLLGAVLGAAVYATRGARLDEADFVFNNGTEVQTLDPATVTGVPRGRAIRAVFEGLLVSHPETLEPLPGMAERWEVSEDRLTYTFHLRQNALWSNGDTVDADDFLWSFERFLDPRTAAEYAYMLWYVKGAAFTTEVEDGRPRNSFDTVGIEWLDRWTAALPARGARPFFLDLMAFYPMFPVCRRNIEDMKARWPDTGRRSGCAPRTSSRQRSLHGEVPAGERPHPLREEPALLGRRQRRLRVDRHARGRVVHDLAQPLPDRRVPLHRRALPANVIQELRRARTSTRSPTSGPTSTGSTSRGLRSTTSGCGARSR